MKLDELEKMAQQTAAFGVHPSGEYIYSFYTEQLQAFAKLIAEHEREACANSMAKIVMIPTYTHGALVKLSDVVNAIRARGRA